MKLIYLLGILSIVACKQSDKEIKNNIPEVMDEETIAFLSKFRELPLDTLLVYSPNLKDTTGSFYGEPLDSHQVTIFSDPISPGPDNTTGFFACYAFPIDTNTVGLIIRTPAMYVSSSVKLFVYDKVAKKVTSSMELAESWGDGGDSQEKEAFLMHSSTNGFKVLLWEKQSHDNSIENPADKTQSIRNDYYQVHISSLLDTISKNSKALEIIYKGLKEKY